jgi:peptidoglycan/xylan/chitin deacetylase (PgdA/CDA1 family)
LLARPILDRHSFPATVFAIGANGDGQALRWPEIARWTDSPHHAELASLTWDELRDLQRAGWEIGAHSMTHASLPTLSDQDLAFEVEASRSVIAERLGSCTTFAYPYGHHDDRVVAAVRRAGFTAACTLAGSHPVDEPFRRPRVGIYRRDSGLRFAIKLSPLSLRARRMTLVHRLERGVRGHGAPDESGSFV